MILSPACLMQRRAPVLGERKKGGVIFFGAAASIRPPAGI
jgi:hypothetical protein